MIHLLALGIGVAYWLGYRRRLRLVGSARWRGAEWRALYFALGLATVMLVESPVATELAGRFFWARTAQVMTIVMGAGPLLVLGSPGPSVTRLLPHLHLSTPLHPGPRVNAIAGFGLLTVGLWAWHLPQVYGWTLSSAQAMQATDLVFAVLGFVFWAQVIDQPPGRASLGYLQRAVYLVLASMQLRFLALLIGFAHDPYYAHYVATNSSGLGSLLDQQLGAGVLLVPGVLSDLIALTACLFLWLDEEDRKSPVTGRSRPGAAILPRAASQGA